MKRGCWECLSLLLVLALAGCVISPRRDVTGATSGANTEFSLSATPNPQTVTAGNTAVFTVTVVPQSGFTGTVNLTITQASAAVTASLSSSLVTGGTGSVTLSVITSTSSSTGTSTVTVSGVDPATNQSQVITATVTIM